MSGDLIQGRPPPVSMTAEQATKVITAWRSGAKYKEACVAGGLTARQAQALKGDADWMAAYEQARDAFVADGLTKIAQHGDKDWKATAWLLERVKPERFARRDAVDHTLRIEALPWRSVLDGKVLDAKDVQVTALPEPEKGEDDDAK